MKPEEMPPKSLDLCCPICKDIFRDPVDLLCSHSFCRECLNNWWKDKITPNCPICRRISSIDNGISREVCCRLHVFQAESTETVTAEQDNWIPVNVLTDGTADVLLHCLAGQYEPRLSKIKIILDWNRGKLMFLNLNTNTVIHTFTCSFTEKLFPYFNSAHASPLKLIPENVSLSVFQLRLAACCLQGESGHPLDGAKRLQLPDLPGLTPTESVSSSVEDSLSSSLHCWLLVRSSFLLPRQPGPSTVKDLSIWTKPWNLDHLQQCLPLADIHHRTEEDLLFLRIQSVQLTRGALANRWWKTSPGNLMYKKSDLSDPSVTTEALWSRLLSSGGIRPPGAENSGRAAAAPGGRTHLLQLLMAPQFDLRQQLIQSLDLQEEQKHSQPCFNFFVLHVSPANTTAMKPAVLPPCTRRQHLTLLSTACSLVFMLRLITVTGMVLGLG
ncbi:hypothetical protein CCH79_00019210 [Gambusia affinis]|uniref:RING-type domain-containing protein n=1 Tax=Gambusia affinis TaxID=33528 RepID=A0A315UN14_GAMAF|nr:hypothetical protein CCH79_00019210 [Gambusia affinis]